MPRRTKLQIQEDNATLLRKKINALAKLDTHLDFVSQLSNEDRDKINAFSILFLKCETMYKTLYPAKNTRRRSYRC